MDNFLFVSTQLPTVKGLKGDFGVQASQYELDSGRSICSRRERGIQKLGARVQSNMAIMAGSQVPDLYL